MGDKLQLSDIKIEYEGKQVLNHIVERYGSMESFIEQCGMTMAPATIKKHLKSRRIEAETARTAFVMALGKGWDDMVVPVRVQLEQYADRINRDIQKYNSRNDRELVNKLMVICKREMEYYSEEKANNGERAKEYSVELERLKLTLSKLYRAKGMVYYYCGEPGTAEELLALAMENIQGKATDLIVYYYTDLGRIANYNLQRDRAMNDYEKVRHHLDSLTVSVDDYYLFYFYYSYATSLHSIGHYDHAEKCLKECLKYTDDPDNIGAIYMKLGLIYKACGNTAAAFEYYNKAIEILEDELYIAMVFNNMASLYKQINEFDTALEYIYKALDISRGKYVDYEIAFSFTLYEINIVKGNEVKLEELFAKLKGIGSIYIYKTFVIQGFHSIIESVRKNKPRLTELRDCLYNMTKAIRQNSANDGYFKELACCYVKTLQYLDKK